jgi:hypothetical protein
MRNLCSVIMAISLSLLAFGSTAAFANSAKPKSFDTVSSGTHGGSNNTCEVGTDGCNTVTTTKSNPAGNNKTTTCTSPNPNVC